MCTRHSDCSTSLTSLSNSRKWCCGGRFCCTAEQYDQGLTSDPFLSSAGAIIGIVVGILVFLLIIGVVIWCVVKDRNKKKRRKRNRSLERSAYLGPYAESSLPGYSTSSRTKTQEISKTRAPDYDYIPDYNDDQPIKSMRHSRNPRKERHHRDFNRDEKRRHRDERHLDNRYLDDHHARREEFRDSWHPRRYPEGTVRYLDEPSRDTKYYDGRETYHSHNRR